jgi:hypothetical protein
VDTTIRFFIPFYDEFKTYVWLAFRARSKQLTFDPSILLLGLILARARVCLRFIVWHRRLT